MITPVEERKIYTPDEYFDFEVNSEIRHEYINGEIISITGGTPEHNEIASILPTVPMGFYFPARPLGWQL